jgi:hypothetical protein
MDSGRTISLISDEVKQCDKKIEEVREMIREMKENKMQ